ncbi:MAG: nitroreductase family protein [Chitinispirillaceae bacterium]|nr:nitroreductase family protein [Chitinispirillaceae bacterium]
MITLLRKRRSIRKYRRTPVDKKVLKRLQEALLRSPSSRYIRPWHFVFIDDRHLLKKLATSKKHGSQFLAGAPLGIVICGNEHESDVWIEDCSIASIVVQLAALECGLGSCWIQIRNRLTAQGTSSERYIRSLLELPDTLRVESIIAIGYPAEKKKPVLSKQLRYNNIHWNRYRMV